VSGADVLFFLFVVEVNRWTQFGRPPVFTLKRSYQLFVFTAIHGKLRTDNNKLNNRDGKDE